MMLKLIALLIPPSIAGLIGLIIGFGVEYNNLQKGFDVQKVPVRAE